MGQEKFKRLNFSLTDSISKDIDNISFLPRDFRSSRSDVLKAAILSFKRMTINEQVEALRLVSMEKEIK